MSVARADVTTIPDASERPGFLAPGVHIDSDHPDVEAFATTQTAEAASERDAAVKLYYAVRDGLRYDAYIAGSSVDTLRASDALRAGRGWCVSKSVLLAACARAVGIGARVGFANVRNHLSTARMREFMGTDVFYYHGYTQLLIEGRWLKATPAFNIELVEKMGLLPLEFDGRADSLYHPFDREGRQHMEYIHDHGVFDEVPVEAMLASWHENYPNRSAEGVATDRFAGGGVDFERELVAELADD